MAEKELEHALKAIDPVARAMLDLSIRRRLPDSSIADLAQMPPDELVRWRGEVLDQLAREAGLTGPEARNEVRAQLESIDPAAWGGSGDPSAPPSKQPKPSTEKPRRERPSRRLLGLLALLVVLVIIVAIISLGGDDSDNTGATTAPPPTTSTTTTKPTSTTSTTTTPPTSPPVTLDPLPGMPDQGTATVSISGSGGDRTIEVQLKGLPAPGGGNGVYELWLYNTLIGAHSLGTTDNGNGSISAQLPSDAGDFRYLDLSRESGPSDTVHSGISVRRAALAPLLADGG
jgi:hypothetical protein